MARKATAENAAKPAVGTNVDYNKALGLLDGLDGKKSDLREIQGEMSGAWKRVEEECGVNKTAAKVFLNNVMKAAEDRQSDFLRSFFGLLRAKGINHPFDLVDAAEGKKSNVTPLPGLSSAAAE